MDRDRIFLIINRVNSVLFLTILLGVAAIILFSFLLPGNRQHKGAVEVFEDLDSTDNSMVKLRLGNIQEVTGHDVQYVELSSERGGRKLLSGYESPETRNVLFLVGKDMAAHWLYEHHRFIIKCVCKLKENNKYDSKANVIGLYVEVINSDTNGDGKLSKDDDSAIALLNIDGSGYKEIETGVKQLIDSKVTDNGKNFMLIVQIESNVIIKKYSLETFKKESERMITEIKKKL